MNSGRAVAVEAKSPVRYSPAVRPVHTVKYVHPPGEKREMPFTDTRPVSTTSTTATDPTEECPYCRGAEGVQPITGTSPVVQAWSCTACDTTWAISVVNPHSRTAAHLTDLRAAVEKLGRLRWTLRQVVTLDDDAPALTDEHLRARLASLAESVRS